MIAGLAIGFVVGAAVAVVVAILLREIRAGKEETAHAVQLGSARSEVEQLKAELQGERRVAAERQIAWEEARKALKGEFATISAAALRESGEQFLQLAKGRLELAQQAAKGDLDQRTQSIEQLLAPLREQLARYEEGIHRLESDRQRAYAGLVQQVKQLGDSQRPVAARDPEPRHGSSCSRDEGTLGGAPAASRHGDGGDARALRLRRAGHVAVRQRSDSGPTWWFGFPAGRNVVVDAKVPLQAFLEAIDASDEDARRSSMIGHAAPGPGSRRLAVEEGLLAAVRRNSRVRDRIHSG